MAQEEEVPAAARAPVVSELPCTRTWQFGIRLIGTGDTDRAQITLPVPVAWPEQRIRVVSIDTTENVKGAKIKKLGSDASQLYFKVPFLASGEIAEASVTLEIEKLESVAPADTSVFVFAKKPGGSLRKYLESSPFIECNDDRIVELANGLPINPDDPAWSQVENDLQLGS